MCTVRYFVTPSFHKLSEISHARLTHARRRWVNAEEHTYCCSRKEYIIHTITHSVTLTCNKKKTSIYSFNSFANLSQLFYKVYSQHIAA